jgi:hypothetical protein
MTSKCAPSFFPRVDHAAIIFAPSPCALLERQHASHRTHSAVHCAGTIAIRTEAQCTSMCPYHAHAMGCGCVSAGSGRGGGGSLVLVLRVGSMPGRP